MSSSLSVAAGFTYGDVAMVVAAMVMMVMATLIMINASSLLFRFCLLPCWLSSIALRLHWIGFVGLTVLLQLLPKSCHLQHYPEVAAESLRSAHAGSCDEWNCTWHSRTGRSPPTKAEATINLRRKIACLLHFHSPQSFHTCTPAKLRLRRQKTTSRMHL